MSKKRQGAGAASSAAASKKSKSGSRSYQDELESLHEEVGFSSMSLTHVKDRLEALMRRVPEIPANGFELSMVADGAAGVSASNLKEDGAVAESKENAADTDDAEKGETTIATTTTSTSFLPQPAEPCRYDRKELRRWATLLQTCLEEFYLLVALVSPATYCWGSDRSGAAEQNLSLLSNEFVRSQEQITARVTTRLNDVLAPVVTLVTEKTITTKNEKGEEVKQNFFATCVEDPDYAALAHTILARNSHLLRQIVLANFDKLLRAINDYLTAQKKDSQHDARGLAY